MVVLNEKQIEQQIRDVLSTEGQALSLSHKLFRARSTITYRIDITGHMGGSDSSTHREMSRAESALRRVEHQSRSLPFCTLFRRAKHVLPVRPWYAWSRSD